jgi:hypothetical protein
MCFSASASFGAGAVLSVIGVSSLRKVKSSHEAFFAGIPLLFAIQQITEGFLWLSLSNPVYAPARWPATYIFLFFAQIVWPFWVPYSILKLENEKKRKKVLKVLAALGALVSLYLGYCLISFNVEAKVFGQHISYEQDYPESLSRYGGALYIIATILPPFFSGFKKMWSLGTAILISYIITTIFYTDYIVSVWCFFAAVISVTVFVIMTEVKKLNKDHLLVRVQERWT